MEKFINVESLRTELEKITQGEQGFRSEDAEYGYRSCARHILDIINSTQQKELIEVDVEPVVGYHKSCGFIATQVELHDYGVICKDGHGKIFVQKQS